MSLTQRTENQRLPVEPRALGFRVLHLLGQERDNGGILTTLRSLQEASRGFADHHTLLVAKGYVEKREPRLDYLRSRHLISHGRPWAVLWTAWRAYRELRHSILQGQFHVLHAHTRGGFALAVLIQKLARHTVLFTNHSYASRPGMYRRAARMPGFHTVLLTPNMARYYGIRTGAPRVSIISECCPDELFHRPLPAPKPPGTPTAEHPLRLVGVGGVIRWKQWHRVLEALALLPRDVARRLRFHHWGAVTPAAESQAYSLELRQLLEQHQLSSIATFHGAVPDATGEVARADWFLLPSVNEPCSLALLEALALGVPALVSDSGGNVDIVTDTQTGLHFRTGDAADLADKLHRLATQPWPRPDPAALRDSVRHRSASRVTPEYRALYATLAQSAVGGR